MNRFNWDAYGPGQDDPADDGQVPTSASRQSDRRQSQNWDFVLGGDDSGLSTEAMSDQLEEFIHAARDAQAEAAAVTASAWDRDRLVRITVNSAGVVTATELDEDVLRRSSPRRLAAAVTEAAQTAASAAMTAVEERLEPLLSGMEHLDATVPDDPGTPDVNVLFDDARRTQRRLYHDPGASGDDTNPPHGPTPTRGPDHER